MFSPLQITLCNCKAQYVAPGDTIAQQRGAFHVSMVIVIDLDLLCLQNKDRSPVEKGQIIQEVDVVTSAPDHQQSLKLIMIDMIMDRKSLLCELKVLNRNLQTEPLIPGKMISRKSNFLSLAIPKMIQ